MIEKVTVSREIADTIEYLRKEHGYQFVDFMYASVEQHWDGIAEGSAINFILIRTLASALLNGYEIEGVNVNDSEEIR